MDGVAKWNKNIEVVLTGKMRHNKHNCLVINPGPEDKRRSLLGRKEKGVNCFNQTFGRSVGILFPVIGTDPARKEQSRVLNKSWAVNCFWLFSMRERIYHMFWSWGSNSMISIQTTNDLVHITTKFITPYSTTIISQSLQYNRLRRHSRTKR